MALPIPMIRAAKTFTRWIANATSEGFDGRIQTFKLVPCGYRERERYKTAIYFH